MIFFLEKEFICKTIYIKKKRVKSVYSVVQFNMIRIQCDTFFLR